MPVSIKKKSDRSTVVVTFRFDQRLHFGLELLARKQHRSLNSVVEWAIARLIDDPNEGLAQASPDGRGRATKILDEVWDQEEPDRIVNLALRYPPLLGPNWERVWKGVREDKSLWIDAQTPNIKKIRTQWNSLREKYIFRKQRQKAAE